MKGLSLTQPYATLIAIEAKHIETRNWGTPYRGPVAIHASKRFPEECQRLCNEQPFFRALRNGGVATYPPRHWYHVAAINPSALPLGAIVAVADLIDCIPTHRVVSISSDELAFGDFGPGRWAWKLGNVHRIDPPIPCRGALGLWAVPPDVLATIIERLKGARV